MYWEQYGECVSWYLGVIFGILYDGVIVYPWAFYYSIKHTLRSITLILQDHDVKEENILFLSLITAESGTLTC